MLTVIVEPLAVRAVRAEIVNRPCGVEVCDRDRVRAKSANGFMRPQREEVQLLGYALFGGAK